jgi:hypothetical protein
MFFIYYLQDQKTTLSATTSLAALKSLKSGELWQYCKHHLLVICTDKKENQIFLIYDEIQNGGVEKSYMRKGFLIYENMRKYLTINEEAVSRI